MRIIYETNDGTKYNNENDCQNHDVVDYFCQKTIVEISASKFFKKGNGYVQRTNEFVDTLKENLLTIIKNNFDIDMSLDFNEVSFNDISDLEIKTLNKLFGMIECIDNKNRQWDNSYIRNLANIGNLHEKFFVELNAETTI